MSSLLLPPVGLVLLEVEAAIFEGDGGLVVFEICPVHPVNQDSQVFFAPASCKQRRDTWRHAFGQKKNMCSSRSTDFRVLSRQPPSRNEFLQLRQKPGEQTTALRLHFFQDSFLKKIIILFSKDCATESESQIFYDRGELKICDFRFLEVKVLRPLHSIAVLHQLVYVQVV